MSRQIIHSQSSYTLFYRHIFHFNDQICRFLKFRIKKCNILNLLKKTCRHKAFKDSNKNLIKHLKKLEITNFLKLSRFEYLINRCLIYIKCTGFAYVGGACVVNKRLEKVNSVAIIEDTGGFSGIIVAAHEVGHL